MAKILSGIVVRDARVAHLKEVIANLQHKPSLAIIQVGTREESTAYIMQKTRFAQTIGAQTHHITLPHEISTEALIEHITSLNLRRDIHGIIVQLPLPEHVEIQRVLDAIDPRKDVDGLCAANTKALWSGQEGHIPATARGVIALLDFYNIPILGAHAVVVGRSNLVGKPTALALLNRGATVTVCHRQTLHMEQHTKQADILILATGNAAMFGKEFVREGQVVIDVGISVKQIGETRKLIGDANFEEVAEIVGAISPVPGGVGPMTVLSLFENLLEAYSVQNGYSL